MKVKFISLFLLCLSVTCLQAQVDRSKMPTPGPAPEVNLGSPATFSLDNGLRVIVVENHKLPRARVNLTIDNKPQTQGRKAGIESLYSTMMGNGTKKLDKDVFNEQIDFLGASVSYGSSSASANSLSKFFPKVFGLMADGLLYPKFTEEEFVTQKKRIIEGIKSQQNSAKAIARNVDNALTYGKMHPYGEFPTVESVKRINLSDIKSYYNNFITPKNAYLVVVGDVDVSEVKKLAKKYFDTWKEETPPTASFPKVNEVQYTQVNFINMPNAVQSEIAVMNPVHLKKSDPDFFAALIANQILGGGSDGRLFNNLREAKGYTYGAYSRLRNDKYISDFSASASVRNAVTDSAVVAFLDEIHGMRDEKVSRQELQLAKAKYSGGFVRALENPSTIARYALNIEKDNLPKNYYQNYLKNINAVTPEEVQLAAKKFFKVNHARIVIVGKGNQVGPALEKLSYKGKSVPVKYFNKEAEPIKKPEYNKSAPSNITVSSIYDQYIKAIGGRKPVEAVRTLYTKYKGSMGPQTITLTIKKTKEGKSLTEIGAGGMVVQKLVFDGEQGYSQAQGQTHDFSEEEIKQAQKQAVLFPELEMSKEDKLTGVEKVNGEDAYVIKTSMGESVYYSVGSGLKLKEETHTDMGSSTTTFSDYKTLNGVKFPYTISRSFGPQNIEFKIEDIKLNENVSDSDFE